MIAVLLIESRLFRKNIFLSVSGPIQIFFLSVLRMICLSYISEKSERLHCILTGILSCALTMLTRSCFSCYIPRLLPVPACSWWPQYWSGYRRQTVLCFWATGARCVLWCHFLMHLPGTWMYSCILCSSRSTLWLCRLSWHWNSERENTWCHRDILQCMLLNFSSTSQFRWVDIRIYSPKNRLLKIF